MKILHNAKIYTFDKDLPVASNLLIDNHRLASGWKKLITAKNNLNHGRILCKKKLTLKAKR
jgi:hypothetical protein